MQTLRKILTKRFPAIIWTLIIFILLVLPGGILPSESKFSIPNFDKFIHISLFGGFVLLWSYYYSAKPHKKNRNILVAIFVIGCLYGIGMEYVQKYFIPRRDFDVEDILADVIGSAIGFILIISIIFGRKNKSAPPDANNKPL
ncbi:MAG TPA: VanZ family protein [Puia sp.]|jgi:VanZ family protein|nr:VanZ family protein [Puia sp.]